MYFIHIIFCEFFWLENGKDAYVFQNMGNVQMIFGILFNAMFLIFV
jgi:hypothetical protein